MTWKHMQSIDDSCGSVDEKQGPPPPAQHAPGANQLPSGRDEGLAFGAKQADYRRLVVA